MSQTKKGSSLLIRLLFILLSIIGLIGMYIGYLYYTNFVSNNINTKGKDVYLFIPPNSQKEEVLRRIDELDIVKDMKSLKWLMEQKNYRGNNIVAGKYPIKNNSTNNELINHLRAGNGRIEVSITFNQLRDLKQLSGALSKNIHLDSSEVYNWLTNEDSITQFGFDKNSVIAMFVPNTYFVDWSVSIPELMRRFHREYDHFWDDKREQLLKETGLSKIEAITMASIVYWETKTPADMRAIAGVYMNRIRIGMPLQADPTLIFAIEDYSIRRVLDIHKEIDSPYNTYKYRGLPPGPIIIPPIRYVDAVLNYERNNYLYFVAKEDLSGESYFSRTYAQHLIYARKYQNELNKMRVYK